MVSYSELMDFILSNEYLSCETAKMHIYITAK